MTESPTIPLPTGEGARRAGEGTQPESHRKTGILLVNVGSPDDTSTRSVRRYLREFLGDPRVIDLSAWGRCLLLNLIILPFRPAKSAAAYRKIWRKEGSPLIYFSRLQRDALAARLPQTRVYLAMRYAQPSIASVLEQVYRDEVETLCVVPMYPQYASASTASAMEEIARQLSKHPRQPALRVVAPFYDAPGFLDAVASRVREQIDALKPDAVLFSYHGLPQRQVKACGSERCFTTGCCDALVSSNHACYRAQCMATSRALAERLGVQRSGGLVPVAARSRPVDRAQHRGGDRPAGQGRREAAGGGLSVLRSRLPRDAGGDRHARARAVQGVGRRRAGAGGVRERRPALHRRAGGAVAARARSAGVSLDAVRSYFTGLQARLCERIAAVDGGAFQVDDWSRPKGEALSGGGSSRLIEAGRVIERGGVNFSDVAGPALPPSATARNPELSGKPFRAMGVSVVFHPRNPYAPTAHMNVRFLGTQDGSAWWFGGGFDLTPHYFFEEDVVGWHTAARAACQPSGPQVYGELKRRCDEYFFLKHRGEARGVGGLFVDDLNEKAGAVSGSFDWCFGLVRAIGDAFGPAYAAILERRKDTPFGERERAWQLERRGRYVEFNLVWDRGTHFGLQSGGRTESILMSMPPLASWRYRHEPQPGSPEAKAVEALRPREWIPLG